ncbi:MAG: folate family ECF transporter S component [Clostridia bacterium]|nr:folate family ECF transporter S component [Clostridia bacterium]
MSNKKQNRRVAAFGTLRILTISALLCAMSIVLGKYLAIRGGDVLRFSFENLPILLAGMAFGPTVGVIVGVTADLVGCLLVGYAINPIVTVGAALIGFSSGLLYRLTGKLPVGARVTLAVTGAHLLGSVLVKTLGLAAFYAMPIGILMLWRLLNYVIIGALEALLLTAVLKNRALERLIRIETERRPK